MLELTNLHSNRKISLSEANHITGSGPIKWGATLIGAADGWIVGAVGYPVMEGYEKLTTGSSDFNWRDYNEFVAGTTAGGAAAGAAIGSFLDGGNF